MTTLTRLYAKRAVTRDQLGRTIHWAAVMGEAGLAVHRMLRVLDRQTDRRAVLMKFVASLPAQDEQLLRRILLAVETGRADPKLPRYPGCRPPQSRELPNSSL